MRRDQITQTTINQYIINIVKQQNPETVEKLIKLVQQKHNITEQEIIEHILHLQKNGKLSFKDKPTPLSYTLTNYVFSIQAYWYWTILALAAITTTLVFTIPENAYPIVYARYLLGSVFVLWLPGYSLIKALFPTKELDNIERTALSIGMSLALVPIAGLLLNYTPWGIRVTPVTLSLLALTITLATAAIIREHQAKAREATQQNT